VLATTLDAVDLGYRVILVRDAVAVLDEGHDALLEVIIPLPASRLKRPTLRPSFPSGDSFLDLWRAAKAVSFVIRRKTAEAGG